MARHPASDDEAGSAAPDPRVLGLTDDDAEAVLQSLSSVTAREIHATLQDDAATAPEVADAADVSLQNVHYHLDRLVDAGVVEEVDAVYSEKGREMSVYAASGDPLVIVGGDEARETLIDRLSKFLGGVLALVVASVAVQRLVPTTPPDPRLQDPYAGSPSEPVPVGLVVFAVGLAVLLAWFAVSQYRARNREWGR